MKTHPFYFIRLHNLNLYKLLTSKSEARQIHRELVKFQICLDFNTPFETSSIYLKITKIG
jgi:hypothetical protein